MATRTYVTAAIQVGTPALRVIHNGGPPKSLVVQCKVGCAWPPDVTQEEIVRAVTSNVQPNPSITVGTLAEKILEALKVAFPRRDVGLALGPFVLDFTAPVLVKPGGDGAL